MPDSIIVTISEPEETPESKANFCIELAFNALVQGAHDLDLAINPVMGLMYLPDQETTLHFQTACRAVLASLAVK